MMLSMLHKNWQQARMQMLSRRTNRTTASTMPSSCGQRGRGQTITTTTAGTSCICWLALLLLLMFVPDFIVALKDVTVRIPQAVKRGSNALFTCNYDMENDTLYSVKWYKGKREFYRYTPKENPAMKVFAMTSGLNVERNLSNQSHVVLQSVPLNISGKFTCEISVEAPTFQTAMVSGEMEVVELPEEHTVVTGIQARYRIGDLVDGNCSIKYSKPAANLTWTINGIVVPPHHIKTYQIEKQENSTLESVTSAIHFMVTTQHFLKGQMRLKCTAYIFDIFKEEIESIIEEDRPRIMASGRSYDINNYPMEDHGNRHGDRERGGYEEHNESYLTYSSTDNGASGASSVAHEIFWRVWLLKLMEALPLQHMAKLHRHINRHLAKWAWHFDAYTTWLSVALMLPLCLWTGHQINNCQYAIDSAATQQTVRNDAGDGDGDADVALAANVTMSKTAPSESDKCFYNCQMALATLLQRNNDDVGDDDDDDDDRANDDGDDDDDANAGVDLTAAADRATLKRQHQQLSATLAKVGAASQPDQRLLMTCPTLAAAAAATC
ncbi:uncharacterized protein LOC111593659 [Drosophila hydei]|uniref:Uncharacterized protein LOC111593659 n=1 Tax=Drosophila hydei TaxID=7224 RepID=A0A6J1LG91_DROHY|nr:uncharacterized protein LOC111593659 [Drosophila hydei]